ncbi:hypothetical protein Vadar_029930 [Vaccinium darrowii]|uniref:Uncharacterized protein n=1 Tax=Vaccinium darrowii TaxID=229202 RepID=A0ACB7X595_9ERIC|nr:hypothetical protein Vadar_029930 [Vaccinium darrowii]
MVMVFPPPVEAAGCDKMVRNPNFGACEVLANDNGFNFFKFPEVEAHTRAMEVGPRYIAGKVMILAKQKPEMKLAKDQLRKVPTWAQFSNVPLEFWSGQGAGASVILQWLGYTELEDTRIR